MEQTPTGDNPVDRARDLAKALLGDDEDRWQHSRGVAACAADLTGTVPAADRQVLVVAAWLHDIGYSPALRDTGLHPLDGARYLHQAGWAPRVVSLVAHHSGARYLVHARGLDELSSRYPAEQSPLADALDYADQRVGPFGRRMTLEERLADKAARHGPESVQARVRHARDRHLRAVARRVEERLREQGVTAWLS